MLSFDNQANRKTDQILVYFLCLCFLGSCGFQPLLGKQAQKHNEKTINAMSHVAVSGIPDRAGQLVRNRLLDRLHLRGMADTPQFRLSISLNETREGVAFQQDDSATRFNLFLTARFELLDTRTSESLLKGNARAIAAYNVVRSDYANLINQRDALRRASESVADNIHGKIIVYFHRLIDYG